MIDKFLNLCELMTVALLLPLLHYLLYFCPEKFPSGQDEISTEEKISGYRREKKFLPKKKFPAIEEKIYSYRRGNFRLSNKKFSAVE